MTDFLDPREQQIVQMLVSESKDELQLADSGGSPNSERKRMIIAPYYEEITWEHYQIIILEASYHEKFVTLTHRDVMGAFLSLG